MPVKGKFKQICSTTQWVFMVHACQESAFFIKILPTSDTDVFMLLYTSSRAYDKHQVTWYLILLICPRMPGKCDTPTNILTKVRCFRQLISQTMKLKNAGYERNFRNVRKF